MNRYKRIARNIASNWTGFAVNTVVTILLTPFVLRNLGVERYGVWVLITSFIGYYGLLDFGFRGGVNQFLTRSLAAKDNDEASGVLSSAVFAMLLLGLIIVVLSLAGALLVPGWFNLPDDVILEAKWCILLVGSGAAIQVALSSFASVFVATQRFDLTNLIAVSFRLASALAIVWALQRGYGLVGVAAATAAGTVADFITRFAVARRLIPGVTISWARFSTRHLKNIWSFGLWNFLIAICNYIYVYLLPLIIAAMMPIAAVGHYGLASGLWHRLNGLFQPVGQVVYPAAAEMHVLSEQEELSRLNTIGSRLLLLAVVPIVLIAGIWAEDFFRLWIGEQYLSGEPFISVATIFQIMLIATVLTYTTNIAGQILLGAGLIRPLSILKATGAAATLLLSMLLVPHFGLAAVAASAAVSVALVDIFGIGFVMARHLKLSMAEFFRRGLPRVAIIFVTLFLAFSTIQGTSNADTWLKLIGQGSVAGMIALPLLFFVGLTGLERRAVGLRLRRAFGHSDSTTR